MGGGSRMWLDFPATYFQVVSATPLCLYAVQITLLATHSTWREFTFVEDFGISEGWILIS